MNTIAAVIFDLDGVLVDSETIWDDMRRELVTSTGGTWSPDATRAMMGMSSPEWSAYMHDTLGVPLAPAEISEQVAAEVRARYAAQLPILPGARDAVMRVAGRWPLGLASSSNRSVIDAFLDASALRDSFSSVVSSEEVARGKPAPDVYVAAAEGLGVRPSHCIAVEDSTNGIRAAAAASMTVVAIPNPHFPPAADALALAALTLAGVASLTVERLEALART